MSIHIQSLSKFYGKQKALNEISFEVKKGEILGFLGPNGAGKSTTMKIITGYLSADSGTVKVCGLDSQEHPIQIKKHIGYLPENNPLYYEMYIHEYLAFIGGIYKLKGTKLKNRIEKVIELCGLEPEQNKKIGALSKGYKQRVGLAQALIHDPEVLILDEPTTGLDPNQLVEIRALIKKISAEKTVIFSTHIMQEVEALCTRVLIIKKGSILTDKPIEEIRNAHTTNSYEVEFEQAIEENELLSIVGIERIEALSEHNFKLHSKSTDDLRARIFKKAVEKNWVLIGLKKNKNSIESIFQELTVS